MAANDLLSTSGWLVSVLDCCPFGVVIVTEDAEVVVCNRYAKSILDQYDGLVVTRRGLEAVGGTVDLRAAILRVARDTPVDRDLGLIFLPRRWSPVELILRLLPLGSAEFAGGHNQRSVAILILDPNDESRVEFSRLSGFMGLTRTEARLVTLLIAGHQPGSAAQEMNISVHTVRSHLKNIFVKTYTQRQSSLVRLFGRISVIASHVVDGRQRRQARPPSGLEPKRPNRRLTPLKAVRID